MECPILADASGQERAKSLASFLNSKLIDKAPKNGSFLSITHNALEFNSFIDNELRTLKVDFLRGSMGWRLNRPEHETQLKKALGKSTRELSIFDATAGMLGDSMIFLSLGHKVVSCEQSKIIYLLVKDACERAQEELPFLKNLTLINGNSPDIHELNKNLDFDVIYLDPLYPQSKKSSKRSGDIALLKSAIELENIKDIGDEIFHRFRNKAHKKIILKRPVKAPLICNKINYQIKGKSTRFDIYI